MDPKECQLVAYRLSHHVTTLRLGLERSLSERKAKFLSYRTRSLSVDEVPEFYREKAIITGYRPIPCSPKQSLNSLLDITNETLNFWTHFIPALFFTWKFLEVSNQVDLGGDAFHVPMFCYMITACLYPWISCLAHAFSNISRFASNTWYSVDYCALSLYSFGTAMIYRNYSFPASFYSSSWYLEIYLDVSLLCAIICTVLTCMSRFMEKQWSLQKSLRVAGFAVTWCWVSFPVGYRLLFDEVDPEVRRLHLSQLTYAMLAALFYSTHFPESVWPGKFDIVGSSHNFLHIFGILATLNQMRASFLDAELRKEEMLAKDWLRSAVGNISSFGSLIVINVALVFAFAFAAYRKGYRQSLPVPQQQEAIAEEKPVHFFLGEQDEEQQEAEDQQTTHSKTL